MVIWPLAKSKWANSKRDLMQAWCVIQTLRMYFPINMAVYLSFSLARNQLLDNPAIVIYATIGNDVCNG